MNYSPYRLWGTKLQVQLEEPTQKVRHVPSCICDTISRNVEVVVIYADLAYTPTAAGSNLCIIMVLVITS